MLQPVKLVFLNYQYIILAAAIFVGMLIPLSIVSEFIFLEPYVVAHLPSGSELSFILIVIVSALSGLVLAMNVYRIKLFRRSTKSKISGGVFGSIIGAVWPNWFCSNINIWYSRWSCNCIFDKL